ncbi:putative F-box protein at1g67390 [Phtheirospermum japonicum]|uniref:Putative F-box protein at1g67390 n=1 Tax=Phtheirospermum japonicum TaxID=374723 RepID=A0A830CXM2_9LAMI|nr:putative F-box protein at1g67390 [Phtheirospermum japonicum]
MPSLEHFALRYCSLQPNLKTPCNSLKTLKLSKVKGPPGSLECILSACVSLCSLTIKMCEFPSKLCFRGPNLQLKCITIHDCDGLEEIEFYASNLMTLEFYSINMVKFIFDYVPKLESIYLSAMVEEVMHFVCRRLGKDVPHLKTLVLDLIEDFFELPTPGGVSYGAAMRYSWTDEEKDVVRHSHLKKVELSGFGGTENESGTQWIWWD